MSHQGALDLPLNALSLYLPEPEDDDEAPAAAKPPTVTMSPEQYAEFIEARKGK